MKLLIEVDLEEAEKSEKFTYKRITVKCNGKEIKSKKQSNGVDIYWPILDEYKSRANLDLVLG